MMSQRLLAAVVAVLALGAPAAAQQSISTPPDFFGFEIGADGELARYPRVLEYMRHLADGSERVLYELRGTSTNGNPYVLATFSSKANLDRLDRLIEINHRLADPRGLSEADAAALAREGVPFYLLNSTIHSNEVGNGQAIINIAHRLATEDSPEIREILDNTVVLLVPSQNPDGQILVVDHWYNTRGTSFERMYPDLYHRYTGHDDNRDWFMFTQKETRLAIEIQREYKPQLTHDMHQMGWSGARIFVPPFRDPYDPNIHPILLKGQEQIGMAMASALIAAGKTGVIYDDQYDLWSPARQYMLYHGQPRILTEIASARLADPLYNPAGTHRPLGPQQPRGNFPVPYDRGVWRLSDIVEYGTIAVFAGLEHMAKYRVRWLENFHRVHRDWVERDEAPYAFVVPANQRDPFEAYELLEILHFGEVEIHRARAPFRAAGRAYPAGSWVIRLAQPYGSFAKTMLEVQEYPDLRYYPGGPPIPPYDVTAHTLGLLMGVDVRRIDEPIEADLELLDEIVPPQHAAAPAARLGIRHLAGVERGLPGRRRAAGGGRAGLSRRRGVRAVRRRPSRAGGVDRSADAGRRADPGARGRRDRPRRVGDGPRPGGRRLPPQGPDPRRSVARGQQHAGRVDDVAVRAVRARPPGRLRAGLRGRPVRPLRRHRAAVRDDAEPDGQRAQPAPPRSVVALGVRDRRARLAATAPWVLDGGTLVALGSSVGAARDLLDLPIEAVLPGAGQRRLAVGRTRRVPADEVRRRLRNAFRSPEELATTLRDVVDPTSIFYCPGSLLKQEHNPRHPVGYGMPADWPVFFRLDQAYRLTPSFDVTAEVVSRYPDEADMTASGWLLGGELLRNQANVVSFAVGEGRVVTLGSQIAFRTQTRATFKLLFNAIFHGPATRVDAGELASLE